MAAALLDLTLIVAGYLSMLMILLGIKMAIQGFNSSVMEGVSDLVLGVLSGGFLLVLPGYFIIFHIIWNGQTPGKRLVGIRVVDSHGSGASTMAYVLRGLIWPLDAFLSIPIPIGLLLISLTSRCRRLGDMAAGTLVLAVPSKDGQAEPWPDQEWSALESPVLDLSVGMAAKLGEQDLVLMRDAICRKGIPRNRRDQLYKEIVGYYSEVLGFVPDSNPRLSLKELYLFSRASRSH